jgi:hypothetical protein
MSSKHDEPFDPSKPALILDHGTGAKRHWVLDQDALVIGRARGSDLGLDASDVSSLHCVITRRADGFRIRDCGSRAGTRVNGVKIRDERLDDGDLLQVGPFSFHVHLPGGGHHAARPAADERLIERLQRSRRNLARQALRLRQRVRQQRGRPADVPAKVREEAANLRARVCEYEQRLRLLEEGERDLSRDRELLCQEQVALQKDVRLFDEEFTTRRAALEAQLAKVEQGRQEVEQEQARLARWQEELTRRNQELSVEHKEKRGMREDWLTAQKEVCAHLERQSAVIAEAEEALRGQRECLAALVAGLQTVNAAPPASDGHAESPRQETEQLRQALEEARRRHEEELAALRQDQEGLFQAMQDREQKHQEGVRGMRKKYEQLEQALHEKKAAPPQPAPDREVAALRNEIKLLEQALQEQKAAPAPTADKEAAGLRNEVKLLRQLLKEKDALLAEAERQPRQRSEQSEMDINMYEEELNQYRRQLDEDRDRLNQEIKLLRDRNAELDAATRELELEMARERAEMARERTRIDRMREEIRLETERLQRDNGVRERLAPVLKLREEMSGGKPSAAPAPAAAPADENLNPRLRHLRRGDTPKG